MEKERCKTKYPLVLVHGIGYSGDDERAYWGRTAYALEAEGATLYFGGQPGRAGVRECAEVLRDNISQIAERCGRVNLIAHSKGGIESRYMISCLGMADKVASLTTLGTPHHGVATMDAMRKIGLLPFFLFLFRSMVRLGGGNMEGSEKALDQMTADFMGVFNEMVPDAAGVYYQSYAFDMVSGSTDPGFAFFHSVIESCESDNDGLVSLDSARWGEFRGVYRGSDDQGISHTQAKHDSGLFVDIVHDLKKLGY
ncbi:MAG: esterase/lipase family protein [Anaerovoracaceae bacterium]|jgi:triacylglycerol lipase